MARADPQFNLRLPARLKKHVEDAARLNRRSATAEIVARLESSLEPADATDADLIHRTTQSVLASLVEFGGLDVKAVQKMAAKAETAMKKGGKRSAK